MSDFTYASAFNLSEKSPFNSAIASSSCAIDDDDTDDACSICLEPFTLQDPATAVTSCKHEYHLQCIIEWSQRSKECPICWQFFLLKDPLSQELLAAVDKERLVKTSNMRSPSSPRSTGRISEEDFHSDEFSSFDEQFLRHLTEAAHIRALLRTRETPMPSNDPTPTDMPNLGHISAVISHVEHQNANPPSPASPADSTNGSRFSPGPSPSEASSLPEAIKSKLAAASARYKESISKSKQGLKEKLLARNNSVKELSKGVQREMNAGIAGVTRIMERLDIASKRFGGSTAAGFNFSFKGKREEATSNNKLQGGGSC